MGPFHNKFSIFSLNFQSFSIRECFLIWKIYVFLRNSLDFSVCGPKSKPKWNYQYWKSSRIRMSIWYFFFKYLRKFSTIQIRIIWYAWLRVFKFRSNDWQVYFISFEWKINFSLIEMAFWLVRHKFSSYIFWILKPRTQYHFCCCSYFCCLFCCWLYWM